MSNNVQLRDAYGGDIDIELFGIKYTWKTNLKLGTKATHRLVLPALTARIGEYVCPSNIDWYVYSVITNSGEALKVGPETTMGLAFLQVNEYLETLPESLILWGKQP